MTRPRTLLVALLCLWLPLQAVAGSWLSCHWLSGVQETGIQQDDHAGHQGCGNAEQAADEASRVVPNAEPCFHCQMSCHFNSAVLLPEALPVLPVSLARYAHPPTPPLASILLDGPHRPPRYA